MSLILEALKKLERERESPQPTLVVLAPEPWPKRRARRLVLALAGGALAIVAAVSLWSLRRPTATPPAATPVLQTTVAGTPLPAQTPVQLRPARLTPPPLATPARRRPLASPPPAQRPVADLRLSAITRRDGIPIAVLNDRVVQEGDAFDGIKVLRIGETEIEVEVAGRTRKVTF
jgi:hypothetical protein